jgi:phosphoenolpyruvate synthase/pyruvate phosphate dikinase
MFCSHHAIIQIERDEPRLKKYDDERIKKLFASMAEKIVLKNLLQAPKDKTALRRANQKLKKEAEFAERLKSCAGFLSIWNKWRDFYFKLSPYEPKQSYQLTAIESAIEFAENHGLDLNMLIGCIHRAFRKRKIKPNFTNLYDEKAIETYDSHYDLVLSDVDRDDALSYSSRGAE